MVRCCKVEWHKSKPYDTCCVHCEPCEREAFIIYDTEAAQREIVSMAEHVQRTPLLYVMNIFVVYSEKECFCN